MFSSSNARMFVHSIIFTNDKTFALFLYEVKPNNFIPNGEIFFETIYYIVFDFIVLSD